jgi:hypothetical protein
MDVEDRLNAGILDKICTSTFKNDIAHMTLEIADPRVLEVVEDIKITFPDMLGTIGKIMNNNTRILHLYRLLISLCLVQTDYIIIYNWLFRWHHWVVYWSEPY